MAVHLITGLTTTAEFEAVDLDDTDAATSPNIIADLSNKDLVAHLDDTTDYDGYRIHDNGLPQDVVLSVTDAQLETYVLNKGIRKY